MISYKNDVLPFLCPAQNGSTALHAAVLGGNLRAVVLLLRANADPTLPNKVRPRLDRLVFQMI